MPNIIAVTAVTPSTNAITRQSIAVACPGAPGRSCLPQWPIARPSAPPPAASSKLSVRSCRTSRQRGLVHLLAPHDENLGIHFGDGGREGFRLDVGIEDHLAAEVLEAIDTDGFEFVCNEHFGHGDSEGQSE